MISFIKTLIAYYKGGKKYEYTNLARLKYAIRRTRQAQEVNKLDTYFASNKKIRSTTHFDQNNITVLGYMERKLMKRNPGDNRDE